MQSGSWLKVERNLESRGGLSRFYMQQSLQFVSPSLVVVHSSNFFTEYPYGGTEVRGVCR